MLELTKSEINRYRKWALLAFVLLLCVHAYIARLKPYLAFDNAQHFLGTLLLVSLAFAFGLIQCLLHKRKSHWTYLVHRPLSIRKIYLSLYAAGLIIVVFVVAIPILLIVIGLDMFSTTVVDTRHYLYVLLLTLQCKVGFQIGQLVAINVNKGLSVFLFLIVIASMPTPANNIALLGPISLISGAMLYFNLRSFKPDVENHVNSPVYKALCGFCMSLSILLILPTSLNIAYQISRVFNQAIENQDSDIKTYIQYAMSDKETAINFLLDKSNYADKEQLKTQLSLTDPDIIRLFSFSLPTNRIGQQHGEDISDQFEDKTNNTIWQFSHDSRLIEGRDKINGNPRGAIGINGFIEHIESASQDDFFSEVPQLLSNRLIMTRTHLYQADYANQILKLLHALNENDVYVTGPRQFNDEVFLISTKKLFVFDNNSIFGNENMVDAKYAVDHLRPLSGQGHIIARYALGQHDALVFLGDSLFGFDTPGVALMLVNKQGEETLISRHPFVEHDKPTWIRHAGYLLSPFMEIGLGTALHALNVKTPSTTFDRIDESSKYPQQLMLVAGILGTISALLIFLLSRLHQLGVFETILWLTFTLFLGPCLLISFLFMHPWRVSRRIFMVFELLAGTSSKQEYQKG